LESLLVDADFFWDSLSPSLFPGISSSIQVHDGFTNAQANSAAAVLAAVKRIMSERGVTKATIVGHSLGGAIANLDAIYLKLQIPSLSVKIVTYGQPRVGNQAFADYMDAKFPDLTRVTNQADLIPIVPGRFLGFHHSHGEIHDEGSSWYACSGQDNEDTLCTTGWVPNILEGNIIDHLGPYDGVYLGNIFC
jgi:predicted lipase